ncbi:MAG TPA: tetratricopeptide repeat protein [Candidatus Methanoperedenaceae archaeon]|nr:tetratricopeptide repeat protein [Candidatus Methanoperedenaceae archaeon]
MVDIKNPAVKELLLELGYRNDDVQEILDELDNLLIEIDFEHMRESAVMSIEHQDPGGLSSSLTSIMQSLEAKGYYRPDAPVKLLMLLVNGLNTKREDIFSVIDNSRMSMAEKDVEKEMLASCAAITQLGYIFLRLLSLDTLAASGGRHVFTLIDGFSPGTKIFVDFSIDSIREIDVESAYERRDGFHFLKSKDEVSTMDEETYRFVSEYYSFFHVTRGIGLAHIIHDNLGIAYSKTGRYDDAMEELDCALRLVPGYPEAHNNLAVVYWRMGRLDEAEAELAKAIALNPGYAEAKSNLACVFAERGMPERALAELADALRLKPGYAEAHRNLGIVLASMERYDDAIREFGESIQLDPSGAQSHYELGQVYFGLGRYAEAGREFEAAIGTDPEFAKAFQSAGFVYLELGEKDRAIHAWITAAGLDPALIDSVPDSLRLRVWQGIRRSRRS